MSYTDSSTSALTVATRDASGWAKETVPGTIYGESNATLAVEAGGRVHLIYSGSRPSDPAAYGVIHAIRAGGQWALEMAAHGGGGWSDLALDARDTPHICYQTTSRDLRYVTH